MAWLGGKEDGTGDDLPESAVRNAGEYQDGAKIPGTVFTVVRVLGRGGHATVYEIENAIGKHLVAKVIHPHLANRGDFARRIAEEARTLVQLEHPNIVAVYDLGLTAEAVPRPFILMERLSGKNAREILYEVGRLEVRHAIDIGIDVCSALAVAHAKKVVHQDIKPDNIFIHVAADGRPVTKLVNFGIVRMIDRPQEKGVFEGTVLYAAPEQLRFQGVTAKTDLFAVGVLLFELMTGVRPFPDLDDAPSATVAVEMRLAHFAQPAPALSASLLVPADLEALVQQCLAMSPEARPESASKLGDALRILRRKLQTAPNDKQLRTEATLLGAVAEVRGGGGRALPGAPTADFDPTAGRSGGRFGRGAGGSGRVAEGVLTAEVAAAGANQSGQTTRIPVAPAAPGRGRFADAVAEGERPSGGSVADRPSDAPTSAPPDGLAAFAGERGQGVPPVGTLDPTVPRSEASYPPRRKGPLVALTALAAIGLVVVGVSLSVRRHREVLAPSVGAAPAPPSALVEPSVPLPPSPSAVSSVAAAAVASVQAPSPAPSAPAATSHPRSSASAVAAPKGKVPSPKQSLSSWLEPEAPATATSKPAPKPKPAPTDTLESF